MESKRNPLAQPCFGLLILWLLSACSRAQPDVQQAIATGIAGTQQAVSRRGTAMAATVQAVRTALPATLPPTQGVTAASPTPTPETLDMFQARLEKVVAKRNFEAIQSLLADPFAITTWRMQGAQWQASQALEQMRSYLLASSAPITFSLSLPAQMGGAQVNNANTRYLFSAGWGKNGKGEAVLVLRQCPDGGFCWAEMIIAPSSFKAVQGGFLARTSVNNSLLRLGPGKLYDAAGRYPQNTEVLILATLPGREWVNVNTPDGKNGWMGVGILNLSTVLGNIPLYEGEPDNSFHIQGHVEDTAGNPVNGVTVYVSPVTNTSYWTEATSDDQGDFHAYVPANIGKAWNVLIAAYTCQSKVMDANCKLVGGFPVMQASVQAPQANPVKFIYDPTLRSTSQP